MRQNDNEEEKVPGGAPGVIPGGNCLILKEIIKRKQARDETIKIRIN